MIIEKDKKLLMHKIAVEETKNNTLATLLDIFLILYKPRLHNGVIDVLRFLRKRGKKIALYSNSRGIRLSKELASLGISDMFDLVVSAKDIGTVKPDPKGLRLVMHKLATEPSRTLYIGDMVDDILTADLAKSGSCAVSCGFDSHHKLKSANPDYLFTSIIDLETALLSDVHNVKLLNTKYLRLTDIRSKAVKR